MEINKQNYYLVVRENGEPIVEDEKLLLQNIKGNYYFLYNYIYKRIFF